MGTTTERADNALDKKPAGAGRMFGDFAPTPVAFTDDVLFGAVWQHQDLVTSAWPRRTVQAGRS